jgi:hypothetical protein
MDKNRGAAPGDARPSVVIEFDNKVIKSVGTREAIGLGVFGDHNTLIVPAMARILTPAVVGSDASHRQVRPRPRVTIGPPP